MRPSSKLKNFKRETLGSIRSRKTVGKKVFQGIQHKKPKTDLKNNQNRKSQCPPPLSCFAALNEITSYANSNNRCRFISVECVKGSSGISSLCKGFLMFDRFFFRPFYHVGKSAAGRARVRRMTQRGCGYSCRLLLVTQHLLHTNYVGAN